MSSIESSLARRRYADVEAAYTSGQYAQSLNDGLSLLQDLEDPADQPLRMRLLLLLAHTWLYGLGDQDSAAMAYRQVAEESEEPPLREIAAEGLRRSRAAVQPGPAPTTRENPDGPDHGSATEAGGDTGSEAGVDQPTPSSGADPIHAANQPGGSSPWLSKEQARTPFSATVNPEPRVLSSAAPWLSDLSSQDEPPPGNAADRPQGNTLAPFQEKPAQAARASSDTDRPMVLDPAEKASPSKRDSITPGSIAEPVATGTSLTGQNPAPRAGTGANPIESPHDRRSTNSAQSSLPEDRTSAEPVLVPSTLSFTDEEEQELARGLLLVVLS